MKKADIRSYLRQGDCPVVTFTYSGFDCGSCGAWTQTQTRPYHSGMTKGQHRLHGDLLSYRFDFKMYSRLGDEKNMCYMYILTHHQVDYTF